MFVFYDSFFDLKKEFCRCQPEAVVLHETSSSNDRTVNSTTSVQEMLDCIFSIKYFFSNKMYCLLDNLVLADSYEKNLFRNLTNSIKSGLVVFYDALRGAGKFFKGGRVVKLKKAPFVFSLKVKVH